MARSDSFLDALASVPLFAACSRKELQLVAKQGEHRNDGVGGAEIDADGL